MTRPVDRVGATAAAVGGQVGTTASSVGGQARVDGFAGPTATLFRPAVAGVRTQLQIGAGPLAGAGGAVGRLAGILRDAQQEIRRLAQEVEAAEREATIARAAAAMSDGGRGTRLEQHAATLRTDAERRDRQLCDEVERADAATAGVVDAVAAAAPGGGATAGLPGVPPEVRRFAPLFFFHPDEQYLPADATRDWFDYVRDGRYPPFDPDFLRGMGNGAPIYFHYDRANRRIDYWYWRRWNDFRNMGLPFGVHPGDWEGMSVQLDRDGRPTWVGYRQHGPICAMPWDEAEKKHGRPVGWPAEGSGATYHRPGSCDEPAGPFNDLAGGEPGEQAQEVDSGLNLRALDDQPWVDEDRSWAPGDDGPANPIDQLPTGEWWTHRCPDPNDTVH